MEISLTRDQNDDKVFDFTEPITFTTELTFLGPKPEWYILVTGECYAKTTGLPEDCRCEWLADLGGLPT